MQNDRQHPALAIHLRHQWRVAAWMFLLAFLTLGTAGVLLWAQEPAPPGEPSDDEPRPNPIVEESKPGVMWVRNAKGQYIKVIDISFERLHELLEKSEGEGRDTPPKYTLEKANGRGEVRDLHCEWTCDFAVRVREPGWVKVPLKLQGMALRSGLKYEGPTEAFLSYDNHLHGYVAWLRGAEPGIHRLALEATTSVQAPSEENRMQFEWPRANESTLTVVMPNAVHDPSLSSGEGSLTSRVEGDKSVVQIVGASGKMALGWKDTPSSASTARSTVEVSCDVVWRIEKPQSATGEASLGIRPLLGSTARTLFVRLPNDAQWTPPNTTQPLWRAERVALSDLPSSLAEFVPKWSRDAEFLRLSLEANAPEWPAEIALAVAAKPVANTAPAVFSLDGFDVLGAVKQYGSVEITAPTTVDVRCSGDESVVRNESTAPATAVPDGRSVGSYKFTSQPYQLSATVARQAARVSCEPAYTVAIEGNQATLDATFKFRVRGVREAPLTIDLAGWVLESVSPSEAQVTTDDEASATSPSDPSKNKLEIGLGNGREMTVRVTARKPILEGRIEFDVPKVEGVSLTPANWTIRPDANVVVVPNEVRGLSAETRGSASSGTLVYRENVTGEGAHFSGAVRSAVRQLAITRRVQAVANRQGLAVEELWEARLSHGTTEELSIVPPAGAESFSVTLQGQPVPNETVEVDGKPIFRIALGKTPPRDLHLRFSYAIAFPEATEQKPAPFELPLVSPRFDGDVRWTSGQGYVEWDGPIFLNLTSKPLSRPTAESSRKYRLALSNEDLGESVGLTLSLGAGASQNSTVIPRAWMQTWLAEGSRRDHVVWRLVTDRSRVVTEINPANFAETAFLLDGRVVAPTIIGDRLAIELPAQRSFEGTYVLEAWLLKREDDRTSIDFPVALDDARPRQFLWHLTPPNDQWMLTSPTGFTSEMGTVWPFGMGESTSAIDVEKARRWIGLTVPHDEGMSPPKYALSAFDVPPSVALSLLPGRWLAAGIAIGVFLSAWLGIQLRRSSWWLLIAVASVGVLAALQMTLIAPLVAIAAVLAAFAAAVREIAGWLFGIADAGTVESPVTNSARNVPTPSNVPSPASSRPAKRELGSSRLGGGQSPVLQSTEGVDVNP